MIIKYISSSGLLICENNIKILIDAINTKSVFPFSCTPLNILEKILNDEYDYKNIDYILFTHV
ncbi:hypothetical protein [Romboutsia sp.]|uniref:hypothetical protein n=1 Tax=Romboutsia sp. TaxID=1965302 RepID=UPI003F3291CA